MKYIKLNKGKRTKVDNDCYDELSKFKWYVCNKGYANRIVDKKRVSMHRLIIQTPKGFDTDHVNGDRLDNRKSNLRICTRSQNNMNRITPRNSTSGHKGVHFRRRGVKVWRAVIHFDGIKKALGYFEKKEDAVSAYKKAAKIYHGEFANFG